MEVHITTTRGAAAYTIDLEPEPTASEAIDGVWRSIEQRTPNGGRVEERAPRVGCLQRGPRDRRQRCGRVELPRVPSGARKES